MASLCGRLISNVVRRRLIVAPAIQYRQKSTSKYSVHKKILNSSENESRKGLVNKILSMPLAMFLLRNLYYFVNLYPNLWFIHHKI